MNKIKNIYKSAIMLGLVAMVTTSCEDWLTLYPTDRVVEENFWEDKNDLMSVVGACYTQLASNAVCSRMFLWGEQPVGDGFLDVPSARRSAFWWTDPRAGDTATGSEWQGRGAGRCLTFLYGFCKVRN